MADIETALHFHRNGNLEEAEKLYLLLLKETPEDANLLNLYGVLKMQQNNLDEASVFLEKAVEIQPSPIFADNLGLVYYLKQDYLNAAKYFESTLENEFYKDTAEKLVDCYKHMGMQNEALKYLKILYENDKKNIDLIRNIAQFADTTGQYNTAIEFYKHSLKLAPDDCIGENNLGLLYEKISNQQQAKNCYLLSLKIKDNFEAHKNLGVLYRKEKNYTKSEEHLKKALEIRPDDAKAHLSLGMTYLTQKKFTEGYQHYILKNPEIKCKYKNSWDGKPHKDNPILIFCDGGFGDYIMFSRYIFALKNCFSKIIMLVPPQLEKLFVQNFSFVDVKTSSSNIDYEFSASVMDLPYLLGMDFNNIPCPEGYLDVNQVKKNDLFKTEKYKVGIFWHGNQRVFKNRSIPITELYGLFTKDAQFFSYQMDEEKQNLPENVIDLSKNIKDFYDTACLMKNLDLMITIDSACTHLAGALGIKSYLMLPYNSEWRWFADIEKTQWYNSVEIFKQPYEGNWKDVVEKISKKF